MRPRRFRSRPPEIATISPAGGSMLRAVVTTGFLSSPRRRRRILRLGSVLIVVAGLAVVGVHWSNTGHSEDLPVSNRPAQIVPHEHLRQISLQGPRRIAAGYTVQKFLFDAVLGRRLTSTWDLVSPSFRHGFTEAQ